MVQLLELGAVDLIVACVLQDNQSVSSWGIAFLHEFMLRSCLRTSWEAAVPLAMLVGVVQPENLRHVLARFVSDTNALAHYWSVVL
ncbi:hypothetical protein GGF37_005123, partial [Kickxella alabastrina]